MPRTAGLIVLAVLGVAVFFGVIGAASAEHYHTNCNDHGLVHGASTTDGAWHARVVGTPCQATSYCYAGADNTFLSTNAAGPGVTCEAFTQWSRFAECRGWAVVRLTGRFDAHTHYAHNRC